MEMERAVVVGAGVSGLLAAMALSASCARVTVIDWDGTEGRAAGGWQPQWLLAGGAQALEELAPDFTSDLLGVGACPADPQRDVHSYVGGRRLHAGVTGLTGFGLSRSLLESVLRTRVEKLPQVEIWSGYDVLGLIGDRRRVTGVQLLPRLDGGATSYLVADLVVDAAGRGSRATCWLGELGYAGPEVDEVEVNVVYVGRHYRRVPGALGGRAATWVNYSREEPRCGVVMAQEHDVFAVVLGGMLGAAPPIDDDGMLAWAESLVCSDVAEVMRTAEPLDEPLRLDAGSNRWRRYDRSMPPDGFVAVGDALCSFNPAYGQGVTMAAREAVLLRDVCARTTAVTQQYFARSTALLTDPWRIAAGRDAALRSRTADLADRYVQALVRVAPDDRELSAAVTRVASLAAPTKELLAPRLIGRVVARSLARRGR
ncbi:FAD-dependent oxidoreductase [Kribbella sandramycini]|nr:2-polyprenyl-6-methoxyphenol hydroxylase-like FAD-dependent oxidoreductase [Kribbella sandramycini]